MFGICVFLLCFSTAQDEFPASEMTREYVRAYTYVLAVASFPLHFSYDTI